MAHESSDWVRGGTPHDAEDDWSDEQSEYGTAVEPEWDDYASEQSVPVAAPQPRAGRAAVRDDQPSHSVELGEPTDEVASARAQGDDYGPVPGQEPDAGDDYRSDEAPEVATGDADEEGIEPATVEDGELTSDEPAYDPARDEQQRDTLVSPATASSDAHHVQPTADLPSNEEPEPAANDQRSFREPHAAPAPSTAADQGPASAAAHPDAVAQEQLAAPANPGPAQQDAAHGSPLESNPATPANPGPATEDIVPEDNNQHRSDPDRTVAGRTEGLDEAPATPANPGPQTTDDVDHGVTHHADGYDEAPATPANPGPQTTDDVDHDVDRKVTDHADGYDELDATQAVPTVDRGVGAAGASAAGASTTTAAATSAAGATAAGATSLSGLYREPGTGDEETAQLTPAPSVEDEREAEERRLQAQLDAERKARERRLGVVATSPANEVRELAPAGRTTDRFFPSLSLFVLRLVTATILGVIAYKILGGGIDRTFDFLAGQTAIPEPRLVSWILGFALGAMAILLVIGMLTRVVGFLLLAVAVAALALVRWGRFNIFATGNEGFMGDKDLLLAAVGLVLLAIGAGAWSVDGAFRRSRDRARTERLG